MPSRVAFDRTWRSALFSLYIFATAACGGGGVGTVSHPNPTANRLAITTPQLKSGYLGSPYSCQLSATGGAPPLTWTVATGSLPPGVALSTQMGLLSGTPSKAGDYAVTLAASDSTLLQPQTAMASFSLDVVTPPLTIVTLAVPGATAGQFYLFALHATGGTPPYMWSVAQGSFPAGLQLDPLTGVLSGTPTAQGDFQFTIQVTDSSSPQTFAKFSVGLNPPKRGG